MTDWWSADPIAEPSKPSMNPKSRDLVVRTVLGEAGNEPDDGQAAVAAVIRNRVQTGKWGDDPARVVLAPSQFEPWMTQDGRNRMFKYAPDSPEYQRAASAVDRVFGEGYDPTQGSTHFFSPTAQAALGRQPPKWAQGEPLNIGRHAFYAPEGRVQVASAKPAPQATDWWSSDPVAPQGAGRPPDTLRDQASEGGRFTDTAGENFRTAREGISPPAPKEPSLLGAVTDIPSEAYNATAEALSTAGRYLNPFSEERKAKVLRGENSFLDTGKGLLAAASVPMAPIMGAARSLVGQPLAMMMPTADPQEQERLRAAGMPSNLMPAETSAENYERAKGAVDTAMSAGGARGPAMVRAAPPMPPALQTNIAAQNIGVELPRAIATDSPIQRFMGQVAHRMPGGGPMRERVDTAIRQTGDAVGDAVARAGGTADPMSAGQGFQHGIETYFKPTTKARVSAAYNEVEKHIPASFTHPLSETQKAIADITARRYASGADDPGKAVDTVLGGATRPGGLTYAGVKDLRTRVGEMLDAGIFPEGMSQGELRRIYSSLSDDLKATVQAAGGRPAMDAFNKANAMHKFVEGWKENLGKVLGSDRSGEAINGAILRMASEGTAADLKTLTMARAAVPKNVWQDVASTAISRLGLDRKGEFSPAIFLNDYSKLSDRGKQLLFGSVGSGDVLPHLNDIATVSKKFVEAGKVANTSGTAGHNAAWAALTGVGVGAFVDPMTALSIAGGVAGNHVMARALSRPASAASIAKWTRSYAKLAAGPTPPSAAAFKLASGNLANTLNGQLGTRFQPADFMKAIQGPPQARTEDDQPN